MIEIKRMTVEYLMECLLYDCASGIFTWRKKMSIGTDVGGRAGAIYANGRRYITIGRRRYFASHLAWLYVYGEWPKAQIDHKNLVRNDDSIDNLRVATASQQMQNRGKNQWKWLPKGVTERPDGKFRARIRVQGRLLSLGEFTTPELANLAYAKAAHTYFGEFARA